MSLIDTDGRSGRFLTRAQNCAIINESGTQIIKEMATERNTVHPQNAGQNIGQLPTDSVGRCCRHGVTNAAILGC